MAVSRHQPIDQLQTHRGRQTSQSHQALHHDSQFLPSPAGFRRRCALCPLIGLPLLPGRKHAAGFVVGLPALDVRGAHCFVNRFLGTRAFSYQPRRVHFLIGGQANAAFLGRGAGFGRQFLTPDALTIGGAALFPLAYLGCVLGRVDRAAGILLGQGVVEIRERGVRWQVASLNGSFAGHIRLGALVVQQPAGALVMHGIQAEGDQVAVRLNAPLADKEVEQAWGLGRALRVAHWGERPDLNGLGKHNIRRRGNVIGRAPKIGGQHVLHGALRHSIGSRPRFWNLPQ